MREQCWEHVTSPLDGSGISVWSLAYTPSNANKIIAGTRPAGFYCSDDNGASWRNIYTPVLEGQDNETRQSRGYTGNRFMRVTRLLFDPEDDNAIWAGIEIDAIHRSGDGGVTWRRVSEGMISDDIHDLTIVRNGSVRMFATTNKGLHRSDDKGLSWRHILLDSPWQYTRSIVPRADRCGTLFLTNGNGPPGSEGRLLRSRDWGDTWEPVDLRGTPNSTMWCVATNEEDPMLVFSCSNLGEVFRSVDGGDSWQKLPREFGDVRSMCWVPW
jgi:photosystem II stability/assembly factor-like uncharacterized protein